MTADLLLPSEAGALLGVCARTVNRWADAGRLSVQRTPGGHRRFLRADVDTLARALLAGDE